MHVIKTIEGSIQAWFNVSPLQRKVGIVTDYFLGSGEGIYYELFCEENSELYIVHEDFVEFIN